MNKKSVRAFFEKRDRAIYMSHLDLLRTMQRALKRSGLPVWYSEGFNPRIYLNFPLALALGVEGIREPMDFEIAEEADISDIPERMNAVMPEGLRIISAAYPVHKNRDIAFAEHSITFEGDGSVLRSALESFAARESIIIVKHTKKGDAELDIKPYIRINGVSGGDGALTADIRLPAGNELNINASAFSAAFVEHCREKGIITEAICTRRTNILCADGSDFA